MKPGEGDQEIAKESLCQLNNTFWHEQPVYAQILAAHATAHGKHGVAAKLDALLERDHG